MFVSQNSRSLQGTICQFVSLRGWSVQEEQEEKRPLVSAVRQNRWGQRYKAPCLVVIIVNTFLDGLSCQWKTKERWLLKIWFAINFTLVNTTGTLPLIMRSRKKICCQYWKFNGCWTRNSLTKLNAKSRICRLTCWKSHVTLCSAFQNRQADESSVITTHTWFASSQ